MSSYESPSSFDIVKPSETFFEIDAAGTTVWEWAHERHGPKGFVSEVLEGTRYDLDPKLVEKWQRP